MDRSTPARPVTAHNITAHNITAHNITFIGRQKDTAEILRLLAEPDCRLVTLVGIGGSGKTRLALEVAERFARESAQDVYFVPLQAVDTPQHLVATIAAVLHFPLAGAHAPQQQLLHYLRDRSLLLVLDNFEQLLEPGGALLLADLLAAAPGVKLLVTSREILNLQEEWLYPLPKLTYPELTYPEKSADTPNQGDGCAHNAEFSAVQLFAERARRVRPDFSLQAEAAEVVRICQLVEGLPLALELAAAWTKSLTCGAIADEIERSLSILTTTMRNAPQQHQSMEAVFAQTWSLLSRAERTVFPKLALFRSGFRREAAESIAGASLHLLTSLVDKSLLRWHADGRYQMHELLRQYAAERLSQSPADAATVRQRHTAYYLKFLYSRHDALLGAQQRRASTEIAADLDNIRSAWRTAVQEQMVEPIGLATEPLTMFFFINGPYLEAAELLTRALDELRFTDESHTLIQAHLAVSIGWFAIRLGRFEQAETLFNRAGAIYQELNAPPVPGEGTDPLLGLSILASIRGDAEQASALAQESVSRATAHNHLHNLQTAHYQLASIAYANGEYLTAQGHAQAAHALCQRTGDQWFMAYCLSEMGRAALALGDYGAAQRHFEKGYGLRASFPDPEGMALALCNLGEVALRQQQFAEAQERFDRSIAIYRDINDQGGLATAHNGLGKTAVMRGDPHVAQEHFRRALEIAAEIQFTPLLLDILAATGPFLVQTGRVQMGLSLLRFVQEHPAADQQTKTVIQQQIGHYRHTFSPALFTERVPPDGLAAAVSTTQMALDTPIPPRTKTPPAPPETTLLDEPLTERETEVLHLIDEGLTNPQIAEKLILAVGTVKFYTAEIYRKLGVHNRIRALARARELKLLD